MAQATFLTARKVALLKLLRLAVTITQSSQLTAVSSADQPTIDPTSTIARSLAQPLIYQQFLFELIALIQSLDDHNDDLSQQSLRLAVGMDRVGFLVRRIRDALPARRLSQLAIEEFTSELTDYVRTATSYVTVSAIRPIDIHEILAPAMDPLEDDEEEEEALDKQIIITKDSCFGLFARQCLLAFNQLSFDSVCRLLANYQQYISKPTAGEDVRFYPADAHSLDISEYDAERFLDMQAELLTAQDSRCPPTADLQRRLEEIWSKLPAASKVHYVSCLNATRAGNYSLAVESLHRYFDYGQTNLRSLGRPAVADCSQQSALAGDDFYQYALLSLGVIHAKFHNKRCALMAFQEAVDLARHFKDKTCLKYALSWMRRLKEGLPIGSAAENGLAPSLQPPLAAADMPLQAQPTGEDPARLTTTVNLTVINGIADVRTALESGKSRALVKIWRSIQRMLQLSAEACASCESGSSAGGINNNLRAIDIAKSNVYEHLGQDILARLLVLSQGSGGKFEVGGGSGVSGEMADISLCQLACKDYESGIIGAWEAVERLKQSQSLHTPLSRSRRFHVIRTIKRILFSHHLNTGQLVIAEILLKQLKELALASDCRDELLMADLLEVELDVARQEYGKACRKLQQIIDDDNDRFTAKDKLRAMLKHAEITLDTGELKDAMGNLMRVLVRSERCNAKPIYWQAVILLSEIYIRMGDAGKARESIEAIYPEVLAGTSLLTESRTHFSYGKACVAGETDPVKLKFAIILLDKAAAGFHQLQSLGELAEVLEIQLHIYRYLNDTANVDRLTHQLQSTRQQRAVNRRRIEIDDWITAVKLD